MNNDGYLTILITVFIIYILSKTRLHIRNQPVILHFVILLFIVFLFYVRYEKSALMASLLYLIMYVQSYKMKEYFASSANLPDHSLTHTENPTDKTAQIARMIC